MAHGRKSEEAYLAPAYAGRLSQAPVPKHRLPDGESSPESVYRLIHDELLLDGSSRLNMATFVTTWMDEEAERLMAETFDKNMIDKDEYPQTAEIENTLRQHGLPTSSTRLTTTRARGRVDDRLQRGRDARRVWR